MQIVVRCRMFCFELCVHQHEYQIYGNVIVPGVLCGCGTWSVTFREEYRLRVFENRVLSKIEWT